MLFLTRRPGETILIGDRIRLLVRCIIKGRVRIGIDAPQEIAIRRGELEGVMPQSTGRRQRKVCADSTQKSERSPSRLGMAGRK
jgi:carbon storage regulator